MTKVNNQGTGVQFPTKEKFLIIIIGQYKQNYFRFGLDISSSSSDKLLPY